jgi:hypothetical protein
MSLDQWADDWQVSGRFQIAGGAVIGAGLYLFDFYSAQAGVTAIFAFHGLGFGAGGNATGGGLPEDVGPFSAWSQLECLRKFSVWDLNGAFGNLMSVNVGVGISIGPVLITARPAFSMDWFFSNQDVGGLGFGGGAGANFLIGSWRFKKVCNRTPAETEPINHFT